MTIIPENKRVVQIHDEDGNLWTVVESYKNYDTIKPVYTIIREDAHASPLMVKSNMEAKEVNKYFKHDIITFFND